MDKTGFFRFFVQNQRNQNYESAHLSRVEKWGPPEFLLEPNYNVQLLSVHHVS